MVENPLTAPKRKRVMPNPKLPYLKEGMKAVYEPTSEDVEVVQVRPVTHTLASIGECIRLQYCCQLT